MNCRPRHKLLDCTFDAVTERDVLDWAETILSGSKRSYICTVNVAILMMMRKDARLKQFIDKAAMTVADGQPIIWLSHWLGKALPERVAGIDLCDRLVALAAQTERSVYFLGATDEVLEQTVRHYEMTYPTLTIAGYQNGYFAGSDAQKRADDIRLSDADILCVAMGVPRQERFIETHWPDLGVKLAIGLGGSFDVISGQRKRAPQWLQRSGLEWAFRLIQEPRRLAKRYAVTNAQFFWLGGKALIERRAS